MRASVFTDRALERYARRFVWLAIDTEDARNADFLTKYPISVWPTLLVISPEKGEVALRYAGGATVPQLGKLLEDGERAVRGTAGPADEALARADRLANSGQRADAAKAYEEAVAAAPAQWSRLGRAAESLTFTLLQAGEHERCVRHAVDLHPRVKGTYSAASVAVNGIFCASELAAGQPGRAALMESLERAARDTLDDRSIPLSADDRSGIYDALVTAREALKDEDGARKLRAQWAAFLEDAAAAARTPEQRAAFDSHRLTVYLALQEPRRAIPMLEQSERDLPADYNPPARLAVAYHAMKDHDKALAASDRALARAYGPRKIGILRTRADIHAARGDKEAARRTLDEAIAFAEALPPGQRNERTIASLKKRREAM
jgi:tetratricopeptide (TPR) repeat protein